MGVCGTTKSWKVCIEISILEIQGCQSLLVQLTKMGKICQTTIKSATWPQNTYTIYRKNTYTKYIYKNTPNGNIIYKYLPKHDSPKFTQIGIFGLKMCTSGNPAVNVCPLHCKCEGVFFVPKVSSLKLSSQSYVRLLNLQRCSWLERSSE
jgi:hypothetical protein